MTSAFPNTVSPPGRSVSVLAALRPLEGALFLVFAVALSLSIAVTEIAFWTLLALRLLRSALGERFVLRPRSVALCGLALAGTWVLAGAFSPEPWSSVLRVSRLYQVLAIFLVAEPAADPRSRSRLYAAYVWGAVLGSAIGLLTWLPLMGVIRMRGVFSTGMTSGNSLSMALVAAVAGAWNGQGRGRIGLLAAALVIGIGLLATETRSSWLAACAGILVVFSLGRRRRLAFVTLAALLVTLAMVPKFRLRAASVANPHERTAQGRLSLWKTGWELFRERPLLGWGLADHSRRIEAHRRPDATFQAGHFHSNVVQVAVSTGILGLAAYLLFHATIGIELWRRRRSAVSALALAVWVAFHVAGFFDWSFGDAEVAYAFFFWMGLGLPITGEASTASSKAVQPPSVDPRRAP
jgi:O-antigen ligase